jgi:hypothetical protein
MKKILLVFAYIGLAGTINIARASAGESKLRTMSNAEIRQCYLPGLSKAFGWSVSDLRKNWSNSQFTQSGLASDVTGVFQTYNAYKTSNCPIIPANTVMFLDYVFRQIDPACWKNMSLRCLATAAATARAYPNVN